MVTTPTVRMPFFLAMAAITGAVAEAYYGIPDDMKETALSYLDERLLDITERFEKKYLI